MHFQGRSKNRCGGSDGQWQDYSVLGFGDFIEEDNKIFGVGTSMEES